MNFNTTIHVANSILDTLTLAPEVKPIVSKDVMVKVNFILHFILHVIIQVFGMTANVINIITFLKGGLVDSVTISFFSLAISDFCYLLLYLALRVVRLLELEYPFSKLTYILVFYNPLFLDISILITVFTAVQKSCCVAIPFLFRNIFTRKVTVCVITSIYLIMIGGYMPFLSSHGFEDKYSSAQNTTVLVYVKQKHRTMAFFYWRLINRTIIPAASQILMFIAAVVLTVKLKSSAKFRQSAANAGNMSAGSSGKQSSSGDSKMGLKELRAIQCVNLVTIIFFICNLPENVLHLITMVFPEFRRGPRYYNLYQVLSTFQNTLIMLNASVNIFIYLRYNTKYHTSFENMFRNILCFQSKSKASVEKE